MVVCGPHWDWPNQCIRILFQWDEQKHLKNNTTNFSNDDDNNNNNNNDSNTNNKSKTELVTTRQPKTTVLASESCWVWHWSDGQVLLDPLPSDVCPVWSQFQGVKIFPIQISRPNNASSSYRSIAWAQTTVHLLLDSVVKRSLWCIISTFILHTVSTSDDLFSICCL